MLVDELLLYVWEHRKTNPPIVGEIGDPEVHEVVEYALTIWPEKAAREWFFGNNDYLEGARPIDFLVFGKTPEVMNALELEKA